MKFKCKLLSDVILNQKAATEGPNQTLDFIPGSCFLGIVASELYPKEEEKNDGDYDQKMKKAWEIFHSGKVCFGDAHPSNGNMRGQKIPASVFYPKLNKPTYGLLYIHHAIPNLDDPKLKEMQLKQCRSGFYTFVGNEAKEVKTETNFAIKSAYDREKRCSKDKQMFGYESLQKGLVLYFEVKCDNNALAEEIEKALVGKKRVGRSKTAQYGLIEITPFNYDEVESGKQEGNLVTVYADGRLVFLDGYGLPTCQPTAEQLGLPEGSRIIWEKTQIRTFQYAPWNNKRKCFDTDRFGIEKGSVFVVEAPSCPDKPKYVGSYNNEGFGRVIYNPSFLGAEGNGKAKFKIVEDKGEKPQPLTEQEREEKVMREIAALKTSNNPLLRYLGDRKAKDTGNQTVFAKVNKWVEENAVYFQGKEKGKFISQWDAIRGIAMSTKEDDMIKDNVLAYIGHGVKSSDWEGNRSKLLEDFMTDDCKTENIRFMLVNLAAEMAKKCRQEE